MPELVSLPRSKAQRIRAEPGEFRTPQRGVNPRRHPATERSVLRAITHSKPVRASSSNSAFGAKPRREAPPRRSPNVTTAATQHCVADTWIKALLAAETDQRRRGRSLKRSSAQGCTNAAPTPRRPAAHTCGSTNERALSQHMVMRQCASLHGYSHYEVSVDDHGDQLQRRSAAKHCR